MRFRVPADKARASSLLAAAKQAHAAGRAASAERLYGDVINRAPADAAVAHRCLAMLCTQTNRRAQAIEHLTTAVGLDPGNAGLLTSLGALYQGEERVVDAIECYRRAIELDASLFTAIHNLGCALRDLGRLDEAIASFRRAVELRPEAPVAHRGLAVALRDRGLTDEAFASFRRHSELVLSAPNPRPDHAIPDHRLRHDREQLDYLADQGLPAARSLRGDMTRGALSLEVFHRRFNALAHIEGAERIDGPAINPRDGVPAIEARWVAGQPRIVVLDDLLSPSALRELRRFCWGSTIWRHEYRNGYLGTMMESGFAQPLILQIGTELAAAFPRIFRGHPLMQAWAFKYDSTRAGIGLHADFAAVNVNFWIAPDEANLDAERGGLVIWDRPAPLDWDFETYNRGTDAIRDFLARSNAKPISVAHRANRAVVFDSDLFHETDRFAFRDGYLNRRLNITFLYGRRDRETWGS